jgi:Putative peptidoglycan binding domain
LCREVVHRKEPVLRALAGVIVWLPLVLLPACVASRTEAPTPGAVKAAYDRILTPGDIHVAEDHLRAFGYNPGPVDGVFTAQTQVVVRAFQRRQGLPVSGLLDRETRLELVPGLDPVPKQ